MHKALGIFFILCGVVFVIVSIFALMKGFDTFSHMGSSTESIGYAIGSIIFPLLLTVWGRWLIRKGRSYVRK
jgi:hypothetical protein